jgi:predicted SprT family Zn-dependent metalloprotease
MAMQILDLFGRTIEGDRRIFSAADNSFFRKACLDQLCHYIIWQRHHALQFRRVALSLN